MEAQTALVGADGAVELYAIAEIGLHLAAVVDPRHAEGEDAVGVHDALHDLRALEFGVLVVDLLDRLQYLLHGLQVLAFARVLALELGHQFAYVHFIRKF